MLQVVTYNLGGARKLRPERMATVGVDVASVIQSFVNPAAPTLVAIQESSIAANSMQSSRRWSFPTTLGNYIE